MKRLFNILVAIIILATALTAGAQAQTTQRVIANIPFAFTANNKTLPAGKYTITVLNPSSDRKALQIRSMNGRYSAVVLTNGVIGNVAADNSKLVFERYDDRYFFAQAHLAGDSTSLAALRSNKEQKHLVSTAKKKSTVVISAG